jgi:hypothetical protein
MKELDKLWIKLKDIEGAISKASLRRDLLSPESSLRAQLDLGDLGEDSVANSSEVS